MKQNIQTFRKDKTTDEQLDFLAKTLGRTKSHCCRVALDRLTIEVMKRKIDGEEQL